MTDPSRGVWTRKPVRRRINIEFLEVRPVNLPVRKRQGAVNAARGSKFQVPSSRCEVADRERLFSGVI